MGLVRLFIKDCDNVTDPAVRERYGILSGAVGIALNLLLSAGKLFAGLMTGSISITADAFNNLSDAGSSVVTLVGFKLAGQKADDGHPFGHGRMEYLAGLLVSLMILLVGVELGRSSIGKILRPEAVAFGGGVAGAPEHLLLEPLRRRIGELCFSRHGGRATRILRAELGNDAGVIGAALLPRFR